jgi:flagellar hook-basal body complex protein FliE
MRIEGHVAPAATVPGPSGAAADAGAGFGEVLGQLVGAVEHSGAEANTAVARMIDGSGEVHDAMIALQRADLMLQMTVQVRNKVVQAYQELSRMPV